MLVWIKVHNPRCFVEVPAEDREAYVSTMTEEVADIYFDFQRKKNARLRQIFRYGAYFSLDAGDGIEKDALIPAPTPHGVFFDKLKRHQLYSALVELPKKQRQRIEAHYLDGMSAVAIAKREGVARQSIEPIIQKGICSLQRKLRNYQ